MSEKQRLTAIDRDLLLGRLDARSEAAENSMKLITDQQILQNEAIAKALLRSARNATWISAIRWMIAGVSSGVVLWITNLNGVW